MLMFIAISRLHLSFISHLYVFFADFLFQNYQLKLEYNDLCHIYNILDYRHRYMLNNNKIIIYFSSFPHISISNNLNAREIDLVAEKYITNVHVCVSTLIKNDDCN